MKQAATQRTPLIEINEATCRMVGECYPENIQEFSAPVMSTLRSVVPAAGSFTVDLELFYFNSSSAKFFFDFFEFFEEKLRRVWRLKSIGTTVLMTTRCLKPARTSGRT